MTERKVPVQSLIDHIKSAVDVDQWAKDMAEELLKEQEAKEQLSDAVHETAKQFRQTIVRCKDCRKNMMCEMTIHKPKDWFCADGERRDDDA